MTPRFVLLLLSLLLGHAALAHEGHNHVMGTVAQTDAQHLVVTDRDGNAVAISLTKDTKYERAGSAADASALTPGLRVVVDVAGTPQNLTATEIRLAPVAADGDAKYKPTPEQMQRSR